MRTDENVKMKQPHPSTDRETKIAVFNKFLKDIESKALPDDFNAEKGHVIIGLKDYEVLLSDGKNQCKLNLQGELEPFYQLPTGLKGFKHEILEQEKLWSYEDVSYLLRESLITSDKYWEHSQNELSVVDTVELERSEGFWGDELKEKILYLGADVDKNSYDAVDNFFADLGYGYEFSDEQLGSIGIYGTSDLQDFLSKDVSEPIKLHNDQEQAIGELLEKGTTMRMPLAYGIGKNNDEMEL